MKFLFVHQNFPGQFLHIVRHLAASRQHEIVFITEPNANEIAGVRKLPYRKPAPAAKDIHTAAQELDGGVRRAEMVWRAAMGLRQLGFMPDIIIGHHGWGEMLNLCDVWPGVPMLGYFEFYYHPAQADVGFDPEFPSHPFDSPRIRAKNAINHIALNLDGHGQTPTRWQLSTYPDWARSRISLIWEGVNLDTCKPDPEARRAPLKIGGMEIKPTDKLVTYVSRDLEPYRGFHPMMRSLPRLMRARQDTKVVMVGSDGVSYGVMPAKGGTWRELMMKEVGNQIDRSRVAFPGRVSYDTYMSLLKRSDAHVYLTYPFVASWSLRESLAMGCAVVGSDTQPVREFVSHDDTGLLTSFFDPSGLADKVLTVLEDRALSERLRHNARAYAEKSLSMKDYLASYEAVIERLTGQRLATGPAASTAKRAAKAERIEVVPPVSGRREAAGVEPLAATTPAATASRTRKVDAKRGTRAAKAKPSPPEPAARIAGHSRKANAAQTMKPATRKPATATTQPMVKPTRRATPKHGNGKAHPSTASQRIGHHSTAGDLHASQLRRAGAGPLKANSARRARSAAGRPTRAIARPLPP